MKCRTSYLTLSLLLPVLLGACASGYKEFYKPNQNATPEVIATIRVAAPPTNPAIERSQPGDNRIILDAYAERGYFMIGHSMFNSGRTESEDAAVGQARVVGADLVLILNPKYTGTVTSSVPIATPTSSTSYSSGTATAYGPGGSATAYGSGTTTTYGTSTTYIPVTVNRMDFGAVFFIKQKFGLGALFRDLTDSERQELQTNKGVAIRLVVDGMPAFNSDLLVGDIVSAIDGTPVLNRTGVH